VRIKEAYHHLQQSLQPVYENREASNIADLVMEDITGWDRTRRIIHHDELLSETQLERYANCREELLHGRPIQYVLGHAWFCNMRFQVDEHVLIPRPETEELVMEVKKMYEDFPTEKDYRFKLIDIGTGSGCIAIALKKYFPAWDVWALDKSDGALAVARKNAILLDAEIHFAQSDILKEAKSDNLPAYDIIISNPPYIPTEDKVEMDDRVLNHEPHTALFVTDEDPLQFYKAIIVFSDHHLLRGGMLFFETHELYAQQVASLLEENGFENITVKKDFQEKERIVFGRRTGASL
jgi:release factor glutamine methyltransferase